jgi:hypothetical protein
VNDAGAEHETQVTLSTPVDVPSYDACIGWMRDLPQDRAITLDFWARGNFVRRVLHQRANDISPFLVPASHPTQMRWAFRRLALAGVPVDFVYTGPLSESRLVQHWHPLDIPIDSGWGYVVAAGTVVESKTDRSFWPVLGEAALMPDSVLQWLAEEVPNSFTAGRAFVAPAKLIGIESGAGARELDALADLTSAVPRSDVPDEAMAILDLEIPWIDGMSPSDFDKLLSDYRDDLTEFQSAFRILVSGYHASQTDFTATQARVRDAIDELYRSARREQFRSVVTKCKGQLSSFSLAMGVLAAAGAAYARDPFAGAAVIGTAGKVLRDLWNESRADVRSASRNPLRLLFKLGGEKPRLSAKSRPLSRVRPAPLVRPAELALTPYHWLCPPSGAGLRFLRFKDK